MPRLLRHLRPGLPLAATLLLASCAGDPNVVYRNSLDAEGEQVAVIEERSEQLAAYTPEGTQDARVDLSAAMQMETLPSEEAAALGPGAAETSAMSESATVTANQVPAAAQEMVADTDQRVQDPVVNVQQQVADWKKRNQQTLEDDLPQQAGQDTTAVVNPASDEVFQENSQLAENSNALPIASEKAKVAAEDQAIIDNSAADVAKTALDPEALKNRVDVSKDQGEITAAQSAADTSPVPPGQGEALPVDETPGPVKSAAQVAAEEKNVTTAQATPSQQDVVTTGGTSNTFSEEEDNPGMVAPANPLTEPQSVPSQLEQEKLSVVNGMQPGFDFETNPEARATENAAGQKSNPLTDAYGATEPKPVVNDTMPGAPTETPANPVEEAKRLASVKEPQTSAVQIEPTTEAPSIPADESTQTATPLPAATTPSEAPGEKPTATETPAPPVESPQPPAETPAPETPATPPATDTTVEIEAHPTPEMPAPDQPAAATEPTTSSNAAALAADTSKVAVIRTVYGTMVIQIDDKAAPQTAANFRKLISEGFYNKTTFHRVIPDFMIQGGDPNSKDGDRATDGLGGPGYTLPPEIGLKHTRGAVAMARAPDSVNPKRESNGSQFYICVVDCPFLDGDYTVFGKVIAGMDVADRIAAAKRDAKDNPVKPIYMEVTLEDKSEAVK